MKILVVSDTWQPEINGVVRTLQATSRILRDMGHEVKIIGPDSSLWNTFSVPFYPSVKLEFFSHARLRGSFEEFRPDYIHIATEGPLGWAARNLCLQQRRPFTTSYHTRFPEYLATRMPFGAGAIIKMITYVFLRHFHAPSSAILVATTSMEKELRARKFRRIKRWSRGVDIDLFRPYGKECAAYAGLPRPILLYVGRIAAEKNLRAFLDIEAKGSKVVIGDGPALPHLRAEYPRAHFLGLVQEEALARHYAAADLFVFPSKTDTFGLVLLEACACGLRIAGLPAPGPVDLFANETTRAFAALDEDLARAIESALGLPDDPALPRRFAAQFSWESSTRQFLNHLQAPTPAAVRRIARLRAWLANRWRRALALAFK